MTFSEKVHTALDVVGMVPVLGEVCDATNAVIYLMEGNFGEAAMSGAACIPGWEMRQPQPNGQEKALVFWTMSMMPEN